VDSEVHVSFVLAEDQEQVDKALDLRDRGARIEHIVYDNARGLGRYTAPGLISWADLERRGAERLATEPGLREALLALDTLDSAAVFIHSSGTAGKPKGLVLSHRNILSGVRNAHQAGAFDFGDSILAYLPMAWVRSEERRVGN